MSTKKKMITDTLTLGLTGIGLNALSMFFQIWLSRNIGTEGLGLYQLICSVYVFATTFATSGISLSVTRLISETVSANRSQKGIAEMMTRCLVFCAGLGLLAAVGLYLLSPLAGRAVGEDGRLIQCFRILSAGLPFMSLSSCLNGFFVAERHASKSAAEAACENLSEMALIFSLFSVTHPREPVSGCIVLVLSRVGSEAFSTLFAYVLYRMDRRKMKGRAGAPVVRNLVRIAGPVAASSYIRAGLSTAENLLIPVGLTAYGMSQSEALGLLGTYRGLAVPAVFFPAAFLGAFTKILVPEIADAHAKDNTAEITRRANRILRLTLLYATVTAAVFVVFHRPLGTLILGDADKGVSFLVLAPLLPAMYLDGVVDGILKGMDEQFAVMRFNVYEAVLRALLVWLVLPRTGTVGFILTVYAGNVINTALSLRHLSKKITVSLCPKETVILPFLYVSAPALTVLVLLTRFSSHSAWFVCLVGICATLLFSGGLLYGNRCCLAPILSKADATAK